MFDKYLYTKELFEILLKMIKVECVWIITLSFNGNRKFSINKNVCLNASETVKIDECWLNLFTNMMRILILFSAFISKGDEPDCLLCWFMSTHNKMYFIKLLRKINNHIITALNFY